MEDVIIEIPEMPQVTEEVTWVPPVITEQPQETHGFPGSPHRANR